MTTLLYLNDNPMIHKKIWLLIFTLFITIGQTYTQDTSSFLPPLQVLTPDNIHELQPLAQLGCGRVNDVLWSPDGEKLYFATPSGLHIYSTEDLSAPPEIIQIVATRIDMDSTGHYLITDTQVWDVTDWSSPAREFDSKYVDFNPKELLLNVTYSDSVVNTHEIWDMRTWSLVATLPSEIQNPIYSPDGEYIANYESENGGLTLYNSENFEAITTIHPGFTTLIKFSPDGQFIVTTDGGGQYGNLGPWGSTVKVWQISDLLTEANPQPHQRLVLSVLRPINEEYLVYDFFFLDNTLITTGGQLTVWDINTGDQIRALPFWSVTAMLNEDRHYLSLRADFSTHILDTQTWEQVFSQDGNVTFSPTAEMILNVGNITPPVLFHTSDWSLIHTFDCYLSADVGAITFSADNRYIATNISSRIILWDLQINPPESINFLDRDGLGYDGDVFELAFTDDNQWLLGRVAVNTIVGWDVRTGYQVQQLSDIPYNYTVAQFLFAEEPKQPDLKLHGESVEVNNILSSPDDSVVTGVITTPTENVKVYDLAIWDIKSLDDPIFMMPLKIIFGSKINFTFNPSGNLLMLSYRQEGFGNDFLIWSVKDFYTDNPKPLFESKIYPPTHIIFSHDGTLLATIDASGVLNLWGVPVP